MSPPSGPLQPTDQPHHTPVAAPPDSHASGNLAKDFFCPPTLRKTEGQSEETTQETTDHDFKPDQTSSSPLLPSPDSELYWSPWLYTDLIIPDHQSGSSALTCSLPPFPHCPGPLLISEPSPVHRPQMSSTEAVSAIAKEEAGADTAPYIDDTIGAALPQDAWTHYHHLLHLMSQLGLDAAQDKCEGPTTRITWIGVLFDTIRLTMAIDPAKVEEARLFCLDLMSASSIPVKEFQKFLGKLFHATKCTTGARTFFNRLLDALATGRAGSVSLGPQAKADIHWFLCFLGRFNGVTLIKPSVAQHVIHVDSCLQGGGGLCSGLQFYKISYPQFLMDLGLSISSLECWNLLVAARIWLPTLSGTTVLVFCDNWATVAAINSGRATDPIIRGSLRELWWLAASHDVQLEVRHKPGTDMSAADTLSRATTSSTAAAKFAQFAQAAQESEVQPLPSALLPPFPF